jgi:cytochrome c-type biogenesis protein CcmH
MKRITGLLWCFLLLFGAAHVSAAEDGILEASYDYTDPTFRGVVDMLAMEGHSHDDLSSCNVKQLYYEEVAEMLNKGMSKDEILDYYIQEQGVQALLAPPGDGFNLSLWVTPFLLLLVVFILIYFLIKKWTTNSRRGRLVVEEEITLEDDIYSSMIEDERKKLI